MVSGGPRILEITAFGTSGGGRRAARAHEPGRQNPDGSRPNRPVRTRSGRTESGLNACQLRGSVQTPLETPSPLTGAAAVGVKCSGCARRRCSSLPPRRHLRTPHRCGQPRMSKRAAIGPAPCAGACASAASWPSRTRRLRRAAAASSTTTSSGLNRGRPTIAITPAAPRRGDSIIKDAFSFARRVERAGS